LEKSTKAIHTAYKLKDPYGSLSMPVYNTLAYEFDDAKVMADAFCGRIDMPDYSRVTNPTVIYYEDKVKALTGARDVIAVNSGMAAISNALFGISAQGKNIVSSRHMFGNTFLFLNKTMKRFGVETRFCDLTNIEEVKRNLDDNTCCLYLEIMTNPQMEVADLRALADVAHAKGAMLVADTTMIPFTEFNAAALGVDVEIVSSTKYLSGGATSLGGLIIDYTADNTFSKTMRGEILLNLGAYMNPHAAYMQTIGLETLQVRYQRQASSALELAKLLRTVPEIVSVNYVGLDDNPYHDISVKQYGNTAGAMITFDLASTEACFKFINNLKLVRRATNLFDNKTLAIHPASTIYGIFTLEERQKMDISETLIRLSVGLEDVNDIFEDIRQAVQAK
jgi:O-acetylhomoserine (thiol)-lyase